LCQAKQLIGAYVSVEEKSDSIFIISSKFSVLRRAKEPSACPRAAYYPFKLKAKAVGFSLARDYLTLSSL